MRSLLLISVVFLFLIFQVNCQAQDNSVRKLSLIVGFGGTSYRGDLTNRFESWGGTFHAGLVFNKKKRINGYLHLMIGGVRGNSSSYVTNSNQPTQTAQPNSYFKTSLISFGYELRINILKRKSYMLYVSPGVALLRFDPKDEYNQPLASQLLTRAHGETYSNVTLMLPTKIGGAYFLNKGYGIGCDIGFLNPLTDYIDNISQLGNRKKKDNLLQINLLLYIPLK
jgi:hypothetical protein